MTTNERKLLNILLLICLGVLCLFLYMNAFMRLSATRQSVSGYIANIEKLPANQPNIALLQQQWNQLTESRSAAQEQTQPNAEGLLGEIRARMKVQGIVPQRYQISGQGAVSTIEFSLQTEPYRFFAFLSGLYRDGIDRHITYLTVKPVADTGKIDIVFRIPYENK